MPTFAVLGATGNVGRSLVTVLTQQNDIKIHALVRSKAKLLKTFPNLENDKRLQVYEASVSDLEVLQDCIARTKAVFLAVAGSDNQPGITLAQDTAKAVLAALSRLRQQGANYHPPRLVVLSSSSIVDHLCRGMPKAGHAIMLMAASYVYEDLRQAEKLLRAEEDWVRSVFIKPGGLVHDAQKGHALSTETQKTFLSFLDLAVGMVEVAEEDGGKWDMKDVSVVPTAPDVKIEWWVGYFVLRGLLLHFCPWLWPYIGA